MMFAVITPALITGAFAERKRFTAYILFSLLWATLVYAPVCHWVWADGAWLGGLGALLIGCLAGTVCFCVIEFVMHGRVDDSLDVFGVHGVGGALGALATGVFATTAINPEGADGLLAGNASLLGIQVLAVLVVATYAAVMTWGLLKLVDAVAGLRVTPEEERDGLDVSQHGETAYHLAAK